MPTYRVVQVWRVRVPRRPQLLVQQAEDGDQHAEGPGVADVVEDVGGGPTLGGGEEGG